MSDFGERGFCKKPVVVQCLPVQGRESAVAAALWMESLGFFDFEILNEHGAMRIGTLEGNKESGVPFVLIRGVRGEFYPCASDIFDETYESVSEESREVGAR